MARLVNSEGNARDIFQAAMATGSGCHAMDMNDTPEQISVRPEITHNLAFEAIPARVSGMSLHRGISAAS